MITLLEKLYDIKVIYFKFYTKNSSLIGSGELTIDTKDCMDKIINDKEIIFNNGTINFYRFKNKQKTFNESKIVNNN